MLVQSVATGLAIQTGVFEGTIAALVGMDIRWRSPVFPGDTIRLLLDVVEVDAQPSKRSGEITLASRVVNQKGDLCTDGSWVVLVLLERAARMAERRAARRSGEMP